MRRFPRSAVALSVAALVAGSLTACSAAIPDPKPAAEALAAALGSGDFSAVPLAGSDPSAAAKSLETAYGPMGDIKRSHTVLGAAEDEESQDGVQTATATLQTTWDIDSSDTDLTYDTQAVMEFDDEAEQWKLRFDPKILAPDLEAGEYLDARFSEAARGQILGGNGNALVKNRPVVRVGIDKTRAESDEWEASSRKLAKLVGIDEDSFANRVEKTGAKAWVQAIVLRDDADREVTDEQIAEIPGALGQADEMPLAPTRAFARPILGSVGQATAEIIEKSEGKIQAGDQVGLSGLQATYNETLAGTAGVAVSRYNAEHEPVAELMGTEPVAGEDLQLSLNEKLQTVAESLVSESDSASSIVAIRPSDGQVLAAASGPESNGLNTALKGRYAPGSVFKVISALAMLREGQTPQSQVQCPASTEVDGKSFKNYDGYPAGAVGTIPLAEAIAESCNTVFVNAGSELGAESVASAASSLGLVAEDGTGAEAFIGSVPDASEGTELAANMIGQGVVEASPLGMATVMASIAHGSTVQPQLVLEPEPEEPAQAKTELTESEAGQLQEMMAGVVDHGTLSDLKSVPGAKIIGKSGTAEYDAERNAHAWVIAAQGDLAVAAFVEDGDGGAQTAGPLVADFLTDAGK
ncbi:penicillin-binding transpeptidase domain-containing protein [Glutamicibacter sp. AOP38-B1-38]|uniref:penicillin-binding transpeptidase domain-containing protein n=1 Tax=Glutamicibacter sp. AOP38-B1-38 TaxID=3457680 RepID=UPI0040346100